MAPWKPGGTMSTSGRRNYRRGKGLPTWRLIRYADDFVVLVHGSEDHVRALREDVATVLAPLGLRLSPAKTAVVHMSDGFDFLGFHIQWRRKRGSNKVACLHVHRPTADPVAETDCGHPSDPLPLARHHDPQPLAHSRQRLTTESVESPLRGDAHGGFGERPGERTSGNAGTALQADSTQRP